MEELDLSNANPEDIRRYCEINNRIEQIGAKQDAKSREERHRLLQERAQVMSRILKANVYTAK